MTIIFRTAGAWGAGKGSNLTPAEVDGNFWDHEQRLDSIETNPPAAVNIDYFTTSGNQMFAHMTDHSVIGPIEIPVGTWNFRGEWQPDTLYFAFDVVTFGTAVYLVNSEHTSEGSFDPSASNSFGYIYNLILAEPSGGGGGSDLPAGGSAGQALIIVSTESGRVLGWGQPASGVPAGGAADQILAKTSSTDYATAWIDPPSTLPPGGLTGQFLAKHTDTDFDAEWVTPPTEATRWYTNVGVPGMLFNDGDFYLNGSNGDVYQQISSVWTFSANIRGAQGVAGTNGTNGQNGTTWYSGSGVPSSGTGVNGDFYIRFATGDYYQKASGTWSIVGNITPSLPTGGTSGQVLTKNSSTNFDASWQTPSGGGGGAAWPRRNGQITAPVAAASWTTLGTGTVADFSASTTNGVRLTAAGNGSNHLFGIYKSQSFASDFTWSTGIRLHTPIVDSVGFGALLWQTSNSKGYFMGIGNATTFGRWKWDGSATSFDGTNDYGSNGFGGYASKTFIGEFYIRVALVGSNLNFYWSYDGNYWMLLKTLSTTEYNASGFNSIGLGINRNLNTGNFNFELAMDCADFAVV